MIAIASISVIASLAAASRADSPASPTLPNPLSGAKTITVHEDLLFNNGTGGNAEGKLAKMGDFDVSFSRPNSARIELVMGNSKDTKEFYVSDGTTAHQYSGRSNEYIEIQKDKNGDFGSSGFVRISSLADIENGPKIPSDLKTSTVTVDGKQYVLAAIETPIPTAQSASAQSLLTDWYFDPSTGLPARKTLSIKTKDGEKAIEELDFSNWALDTPIDPKTYEWNPPAGSKAHVDPPQPKLLGKGDIAPDFTAITPDGKKVKLSSLRGKIVVVDFWATWCGPCQVSMPHLEKVYKQVKAKGVSVLAVCVWDDKANFDKWVTDKKGIFSFPVVFDPAGRSGVSVATPFGVSGIPSQFVIGKTGKIVGSSVGYSDGDTDLEKNLAAAGIKVANK
jgi:peroxiredoxin/outer membrane lipoprotein-sorting protein